MSEEYKGIAFVADDGGPELVTLPKGTQIFPSIAVIDEQRIRLIVREELAKMMPELAKEIVQQVRMNAGRREG